MLGHMITKIANISSFQYVVTVQPAKTIL